MNRILVTCVSLLFFGCGPQGLPSSSMTGDASTGRDGGSPPCQGAQCHNFCENSMTTLSGVVTAPNGIDPVPGAVVYVPLSVEEFPSTVACEVCNQLTDTAYVSTETADDGSFTLGPIPTPKAPVPGSTVTIVAQKGRFRRVSEVPIKDWCQANIGQDAWFSLPGRNEGMNRIPKIAVATGDYDVMECVLLKLGIEAGSFDLYEASLASPGTDPGFDTLLSSPEMMRSYNIIFINCTSNQYEHMLEDAAIRNNIREYVASGGRLYVTDWSYDYVEQIAAWSGLIDFEPGMSGAEPEPLNDAAVGAGGITTEAMVLDSGLGSWLEAVERRTGDSIVDGGRVHIDHFLSTWVMQREVPANEDTNSTVWLEGMVRGSGITGVKPLTTTFDFMGCGRVLYSSYHTAGRSSLEFVPFPDYCLLGEPLSPQERVLEYLILHVADCIDIN